MLACDSVADSLFGFVASIVVCLRSAFQHPAIFRGKYSGYLGQMKTIWRQLIF